MRLFLTIAFVSFCAVCSAQSPKSIKFSKDKAYLYFFQVGQKADTLRQPNDRLFYYLVPDSLKPHLILQSENASFVPTQNDSIVRCNSVPGIRYESFFSEVEGDLGADPKKYMGKFDAKAEYKPHSKKMILRCGTNGASVIEPKKILVQIVDKRSNKVIIENVFYAP